MNELIDWSSQI